jgi:hypothetical protein
VQQADLKSLADTSDAVFFRSKNSLMGSPLLQFAFPVMALVAAQVVGVVAQHAAL